MFQNVSSCMPWCRTHSIPIFILVCYISICPRSPNAVLFESLPKVAKKKDHRRETIAGSTTEGLWQCCWNSTVAVLWECQRFIAMFTQDSFRISQNFRATMCTFEGFDILFRALGAVATCEGPAHDDSRWRMLHSSVLFEVEDLKGTSWCSRHGHTFLVQFLRIFVRTYFLKPCTSNGKNMYIYMYIYKCIYYMYIPHELYGI